MVENRVQRRLLRNRFFPFFILALLLHLTSFPSKAEKGPHSRCITVDKAGVASAHREASRVGSEIMRQGGNAADAATAVAMALAVVYPQAGNLGGGGFLLYRQHTGRVYVLDFRETAPAASRHDMYLDSLGNVLWEKSRLGGLAVGVPGTVRGFYHFHRKFGNLPWETVLKPAVHLAENGFVVNTYIHQALRNAADDLKKFPSSRAVFLPHGSVPQPGSRFCQPKLARSLSAVARHRDTVFYEGYIAREIVKAVQQYGGILTLDDLRNYQAVERQPVEIEYGGYRIYAVPPPSSGGVVLKGLFNCLHAINPADYPFHSPEQIAFLTELEKHYFAFRNTYLGDPDFVKMPLDRLMSPALANDIVNRIDIGAPIPAEKIAPAEWVKPESQQTTHFSVIDPMENVVSVTYTLNGNFGSKLVAGSTGILLNNEMDDFTAKPGSPNLYGLVQGEVNSIAAGKRMLSSMSPVIVSRGGRVQGALGSPGGPRIITTLWQVLVNLIVYRMSLPDAVEAGRFHHQWLPDSLYIEANRFDPEVLKTVEHWGYNMVKSDHLGDVQALWRLNHRWQVCSDPRGNGSADGW